MGNNKVLPLSCKEEESLTDSERDEIQQRYGPTINLVLHNHIINLQCHPYVIRKTLIDFLRQRLLETIKQNLRMLKSSNYHRPNDTAKIKKQLLFDIQKLRGSSEFKNFVMQSYLAHSYYNTRIGSVLLATSLFAVALDAGYTFDASRLRLNSAGSSKFIIGVWVVAIICAAIGAYCLAESKSSQNTIRVLQQRFFGTIMPGTRAGPPHDSNSRAKNFYS